MKKIISDSRFEHYLDGGGVSDLHPDISHAVYAAFASGLIRTNWSWAGTVGKHTDGCSTNHPELVTYQDGCLGLSVQYGNEKSGSVVTQILEMTAQRPFVKLEEYNGKYLLILKMDDLVLETAELKSFLGTQKISLIRESEGITRYGEFMAVWNGIYDLLYPHVVIPTDRANLGILAADVDANSRPPYPRRTFCDFTKNQFQ